MTPQTKAALKEAYATAPVADTILDALEIQTYDDAGAPLSIYIHQGTDTGESWVAPTTAGGTPVTWLACAFDLTLPGQDDGAMLPELTLAIDNVSGMLSAPLDNALKAGKPIRVLYRAYLASDASGPQTNPPLALDLADITVTALRVTAKARIPDITSRGFPAKAWTPAVAPTLGA